jgi:hypothetical protein
LQFIDDVEYEEAGPKKVSVVKKKEVPTVVKIEGPTHALLKKPENQTIVEGK